MLKLKKGVPRPAMPMLISNWVVGMGIIEYPLGTQHRIISFTYTTILLITYISLAVYAYPYLIQMTEEFEINRQIIRILFYCHVILTICTVGLGWQRSKVNILKLQCLLILIQMQKQTNLYYFLMI